MCIRIYDHPTFRSTQRDPNPKDTSLVRKETSTYFRDSILRLQHCVVQECLSGLGSLCLLFKLGLLGRPGLLVITSDSLRGSSVNVGVIRPISLLRVSSIPTKIC